MAKDPGYVYILTNESFREDWVKIGKSSRPVDVRSKELDNTAVPLPFEIYATLRSQKYNEVEKQLHGMLDLLTNTRIRKKREFFNVKPEDALRAFNIIATTLDDAVIEIYQDGKVVNSINKTIIPDEPEPEPEPEIPANAIECSLVSAQKGFNSKALLFEDGKMTLLKGSIICNTTAPSLADYAKKQREALITSCCKEDNTTIITTQDIHFQTPSGPAIFVCGRSANGWNEWKDKDGNVIMKYRK